MRLVFNDFLHELEKQSGILERIALNPDNYVKAVYAVPTLGGATLGAATGALSAGKDNRRQGALVGGLLGAGLGHVSPGVVDRLADYRLVMELVNKPANLGALVGRKLGKMFGSKLPGNPNAKHWVLREPRGVQTGHNLGVLAGFNPFMSLPFTPFGLAGGLAGGLGVRAATKKRKK